MTVQAVGTSRKGRSSRRLKSQTKNFKMLPGLRGRLPLTEPLDPDQIQRIDNASMDILENTGIHFRDKIALQDWKSVGAKIVEETVFLDRYLVKDLIKSIPETFTYHARNPENNLYFGKNYSMFVPMTGAPYLRDLEDKRRNPTLDDLANFHKPHASLNAFKRASHS